MTPTARYALNGMGGTVAAIAVMFVALRFWDYSEQTDFRSLSLSTWGWIAVCSIIYCLANLFLTQGWRLLLRQFGSYRSFKSALYIYGVSQLAKYVPGNIFHLAGRQALGMVASIPSWTLARSSLWELALIAISALIFGERKIVV